MERRTIKKLGKALPFQICSDFEISQLSISGRNRILEMLEANNFSRNMIKHVNGFSKNNYTCNYYQENSIQNLYKKHLSDSLKIFHLNIESFKANSRELSSYLKCLSFKFDIICLTEIRKTSVGIINKEFPDFDIFIDNPVLAKGGVAILLRKNKFDQITEIDAQNNFNLKTCGCNNCHIENKWLSFKIQNQDVILGGIYRHPNSNSNVEHFTTALDNTLSQINNGTLAIVLGDININLLDENNHKVNQYINNLLEKNFIPCITLPTRIRNHSATLIDHIFIRCPKKLLQNKCSSGNLITDITDHLPNFTFLDIKTPTIKKRPFTRLFTKNKIKSFNDNLNSEASLIADNELHDVNNSYAIFSANYFKLFDKYFPYVRISRKAFRDKPYITSGIKVSIKTRNRLYKKYLDNPSEINKVIWKRFRNKTSETIKRAEELYFKNILNNHTNGTKKLWNTFGKILNKNKIKHKRINSLLINDKKITNPQAISNIFNDFFSEIGERLANNFSNIENSEYRKSLGKKVSHSIVLYPITEIEVKDTIRNLKNTNSAGYDELTTKFIKVSAPLLIPALTKIFNLSITAGVYPNSLKTAKITPVFKKGDPSSVNNYRPISVLSSINKIYEKILYSRLINFIEKFNIFYEYQYGFRKNHSTEHALIEMVDNINLSIDNNQLTCGIFLDLSKAFDTVNHQILLGKLEHYGIRGKVLDLFKSYLSNRTQYVQIENHKSKTRTVSCGVPQGSVLGPLFFLLYINDLPNCCPTGNVRIFADDTSIFFHCYNIEEIVTKGTTIMTQLHSWFCANKLTLNTDKSSFTIFRSKRKNIPNLPEYIEFKNHKIKRTTHIKFLGIILDEKLLWDHQINEVCNKLKSLFHIFYNIRDYLSHENIKTIYYTLIYSRIKYGIAVYSQAARSKMNKIQTLQNQLMKVLSGKPYRFPTDALHNEFDILKVEDIENQEILTFVQKCLLGKVPPIFKNYYQTNETYHDRNTRSGANRIVPPRAYTSYGDSTIKIRGAQIWNGINPILKSIVNIKNFRRLYKEGKIPYL